jgi:hypothetical protein
MGGAASKPRITRSQLLAATQDNRDFINKLFNAMMSELTPEDFLKLGRSQQCSQFVFMMADSIGSLFESIRVRPKKDKDTGVVYFQRITALTKPTTPARAQETRELCITIAYFYIRIFQIFGSLAMTVLDYQGAGDALGVLRYGAAAAGSKPGGVRPQEPGRRVAFLYGGGLEEVDADEVEIEDEFEIRGVQRGGDGSTMPSTAELYVVSSLFEQGVPKQVAPGQIKAFYKMKGFDNVEYIPRRTDPKTGKAQNLRVVVGDMTLYGNMSLTRLSARELKYTVTLSNFIVGKLPDTTTAVLDGVNKKFKQFTDSFTIRFDEDQWVLDKTGEPAVTKFAGAFDVVENIARDLVSNPDQVYEDLPSVPKAQRNAIKAKKAQVGYDGRGVAAAAGGEGDGRGDTFVLKPLRQEYIVKVLKGLIGFKTVNFCVARALQLLDANTLAQPRPTSGYSGVCMAKFEPLPTSVPQVGQSITTVPGIQALDQLFYTKPAITAQDQHQVLLEDPAAYADFLSEMAGLFGTTDRAKELRSADEIKARKPCEQVVSNYLQITDPKTIKEVVGVVNSMFSRELAHTRRVIEFFRTKMFVLKKRGGGGGVTVELHPRLLRGGIDEVNKLGAEARKMLIEYYKGCEEMYQEGARIMLRSGARLPRAEPK